VVAVFETTKAKLPLITRVPESRTSGFFRGLRGCTWSLGRFIAFVLFPALASAEPGGAAAATIASSLRVPLARQS